MNTEKLRQKISQLEEQIKECKQELEAQQSDSKRVYAQKLKSLFQDIAAADGLSRGRVVFRNDLTGERVDLYLDNFASDVYSIQIKDH